MASTGRPTRLTPKLQNRICDLLAKGVPVDTAASGVKLTPRCVQKWRARGREELERLEEDPTATPDPNEQVYVRFFQSTEAARAEWEANAIIELDQLSDVDPDKRMKVLMWKLSRARRENWGRDTRPVEDTQDTAKEEQQGVVQAVEQMTYSQPPLPVVEE